MRVDLSSLPTTVFNLTDSYPEPYYATSPCSTVPGCSSPAVQLGHVAANAKRPGLPLGLLLLNTTEILPNNGGVKITMAGGASQPGCSGGRTLIYNMVCDATAPAGA